VYIVYKIVNLVNRKYYIGVHNGKNPNYMGSGKLIKAAIKKHGIENFEKRIIYSTPYKELAYKLERSIVTESFIKENTNYNLKEGGIGGRNPNSYTDKERRTKSERMKKNNPSQYMTDETKQKMSDSHKGKTSSSKGNFKKEGDGKWEGTAHKGKENPRAKLIYIFNKSGDIIHKCNGTFHRTLQENNMPNHFRKSLTNIGEPIFFNWRYIKKEKREMYKKYEGWYAKEILDVE